MDSRHIRNFSIVAHIDHGKSTLADRMLEITGAVQKREMRAQLLDDMDLERERGITIKAHAVTIMHRYQGELYELNLIDTPGHVDFHYEVEKSMQACEGAILLVDASQGVEAQTVANALLAIDADLEIIPVLNKTDLPHARPDEVAEEIENSLTIEATDAIHVSAKTGERVNEVLDRIVERVPPPQGNPADPLRALIFDAVYDEYRGVIVYMRVFDGTLKRRDMIQMLGTGKVFEAIEIGRFTPKMTPAEELQAGEVGYFISNIKSLGDVRIGDTMALHRGEKVEMLPGYREPQHMVFADFYPTNPGDYEVMRDALATLSLSDSSFSYEPVTSDALGFGYRCGFLGLLHMEIIQQRLEREHDLDMIQTAPSVTYEVVYPEDRRELIHSPGALPAPDKFEALCEPIVRASILIPAEHIGAVMQISSDHRGAFVRQEHLSTTRVQLVYDIPLAEIMYDFYDKLKSATRGYGTLDYEMVGYQEDELVKLKILVNGDEVDALCSHRAPFTRGDTRPRSPEEVAQGDPTTPVRSAPAGRGRRAHHRPREHRRAAQGRHGQVLRRRHHAQAQAAREAEGRQAPHAASRSGRHSAEGFPVGAGRRRSMSARASTASQSGAASKADAPKKRKRPWRENIEAVTMALVMAVMLKYFIIEAYKIPTGSMQPTLLGNDDTNIYDRILVDKLSYHFRDPKRFEVAVFRYPLDRSKNFIKRIVGVGGEDFRIANGDLWSRPDADTPWQILRRPRRVQQETWKHLDPEAGWRIEGSSRGWECEGATIRAQGEGAARFPGDRSSIKDRYKDGYPGSMADRIKHRSRTQGTYDVGDPAPRGQRRSERPTAPRSGSSCWKDRSTTD